MMEGERVHQRAGRFSIDASGSDDGGWSWGSRCRDGDLNINIVDSAHGLQDTGTTGHMLIGKIVYHKLGSCMPYGHRDGLVLSFNAFLYFGKVIYSHSSIFI